MLFQIIHQGRRRRPPFLEGDESRDRLALDVVRPSYDRRFGNIRIVDERAFDLHRPDAMARDVQNVVDAPENPKIAIGISLGAVSWKIDLVRPLAPVGRNVTLRITVNATEHRRPRTFDGEKPAADLDRVPPARYDVQLDPGERLRRRARLRLRYPRKRRTHDRAGLRLPPRIHDGTTLAANVLVVPHPRFRIDGLAHRSQKSQRRQVVLLGPLRAPLHESADGRGRGIETRHPVLLYDRPEAVFVGPVGRAFVHHTSDAESEWPIDDIAVSRHPADIGRGPPNVIVFEIEDIFGRGRDLRQIAPRRMDDALGLSRRAGGVEDVEHVLRIHRLGLAIVVDVVHENVPPVIASFFEVDLKIAAFDDDDVLDTRRTFDRLVGEFLQGHDVAASVPAICSNHELGFGIIDAISKRVRAESAENDTMHGANPGAGQHRDRKLGDHRKIDRDPIALPDAQLLQHIGEPIDLAVEIPIGERASVARLTFPDERSFVAAGGRDMTVETVGAHV